MSSGLRRRIPGEGRGGPGEGRGEPDDPAEVNSWYSPESARELLEPVASPWWVAGGSAIDLFLQRVTRDHEDLDLAILRRDEGTFRRLLQDWQLWPSLGEGRLDPAPLQAGSPVPPDRDAVWCRRTPESRWAFELLISGTDGDEWIFKRNAAIRVPIARLGLTTAGGVPFLRPEVVLLFKAKGMRARDRADFDQVVGHLNSEVRQWLRGALLATHPGHEWIERLNDQEAGSVV